MINMVDGEEKMSKNEVSQEAINMMQAKKLTTAEMVCKALTDLHERKGCSLQAIIKYMEANYLFDYKRNAFLLKRFLKVAVESGTVAQTKGKGASGSFKLVKELNAEKKKPKKPTTSKVTKTAKKGAVENEEANVQTDDNAKSKSSKVTKLAKKGAVEIEETDGDTGETGDNAIPKPTVKNVSKKPKKKKTSEEGKISPKTKLVKKVKPKPQTKIQPIKNDSAEKPKPKKKAAPAKIKKIPTEAIVAKAPVKDKVKPKKSPIKKKPVVSEDAAPAKSPVKTVKTTASTEKTKGPKAAKFKKIK